MDQKFAILVIMFMKIWTGLDISTFTAQLNAWNPCTSSQIAMKLQFWMDRGYRWMSQKPNKIGESTALWSTHNIS